MKESNIKKLPVNLNNEIEGIVTEKDLTQTIVAFSESIEELIQFYANSRKNIKIIMDDWGDILVSL